jgi:hypothetical protein
MRLWDHVFVLFRGLDLGVLGQRAVGKTVLQTFLREGYLEHSKGATVAATRQQWGRSSLRGSSVARVPIRRGTDVPGDSLTNADDWRAISLEADVLLYLFDVARLLEDDRAHNDRMLVDAELVSSFLAERPNIARRPPVVSLVGTHCDRAPGYQPPSTGIDFYLFFKEVYDHDDVQRVSRMIGADLPKVPRPVVGSLQDEQAANDLCWRVFTQELGVAK